MYINIEKKAAITRLLLSLPVFSIQIMFSFSFSLYFASFKYYNIIIIYVSRNYIIYVFIYFICLSWVFYVYD
jgi:hypothetical protein